MELAATAQSGSTPGQQAGWMRGKENNGAKKLLHARQRQEFLNEERTQKDRRTGAAGNKRKDKKQEALEKRSRHRKTQQDTVQYKETIRKQCE